MKDRIDLNQAKAAARDASMSLPSTIEERFIVMQKIGKTLQDTHGSFFLGQVYDVLELVYDIKKKDRLISEIEQWVENDEKVEHISDDNEFYVYRINIKK